MNKWSVHNWGDKCWFLHNRCIVEDTGATKYIVCLDCSLREIVQKGGYQPVDIGFLTRHDPVVRCDLEPIGEDDKTKER